jgi:CheY-like chemotaxis protein
MGTIKVLVVDDSTLLHRMYEITLRGYALLYASDGLEALAKLAAHDDVRAVLLDVNMPRMNGLECLARIRADERAAKLPVVMVTTEGREADADRAIAAGATAYVTKPFRNERLRELVAALVGGSAP